MKYKRFVYTPVILIIATVKFTSGSGDLNEIRKIRDRYNHASNLERIVAMWNRSAEASYRTAEDDDKFEFRSYSVPNFPLDVSKCIEDHQYQITENFSQGKNIILNCFKTSLMLNVLGGYLAQPSKSTIKLFNGMLEFKKIPEKGCTDENCDKKHRNFGLNASKKSEYIRMYKKAMQRLATERSKYHSYRNLTEEEKAKRLSRIDENSQAFLSEVIRNLGNEDAEKREEENLAKEITDPKLVATLDALSRNYMLKLRFYPGVTARMMRSNNGGFTFDLEIPDAAAGADEVMSSDESLTREIKDTSEIVDSSEEDVSDSIGRKKDRKKEKYKRKYLKKKWKGLKKFLPYLLLPLVIQLTLLPFVFKKLFFLAMKALFAGKVALILVGFNLLRNTCIHNDDFQRIRVEHYGYRRGGEYGAWINGRSLGEPSLMSALSEEPYGAHKPVRE